MRFPLIATLLLLASFEGCVRYEYEHEFWVEVDGSGTVHVTGRPALWAAFKGVGQIADPDQTISRDELRRLFERSGMEVRRITRTRRSGKSYLFISADFEDINALSGTPAFPDLEVHLARSGKELELSGKWAPHRPPPGVGPDARGGLMAVRFHLPSRVHSHKNAFGGVQRGNIVGWRQDVESGLAGKPLEFGATMDQRSILHATLLVFAKSIVIALGLVGLGLYLAYRKGKRDLERHTPRFTRG
jgi:hypothetical protein